MLKKHPKVKKIMYHSTPDTILQNFGKYLFEKNFVDAQNAPIFALIESGS